MAVLLLWTFSPTVGKVKMFVRIVKNVVFLWLRKTWRLLAFRKEFCWIPGTQLLKPHTTEAVLGKPRRMIQIHTFPWTHQDDTRFCVKELTAIIYRVLLEACWMPHYFTTDKLLVFWTWQSVKAHLQGRDNFLEQAVAPERWFCRKIVNYLTLANSSKVSVIKTIQLMLYREIIAVVLRSIQNT